MEINTALSICRMVYAVEFLPTVCLDEHGEVLASFCTYPAFHRVAAQLAHKIPKRKPFTLLSAQLGMYGAIRVEDCGLLVLVGPFLNKKITEPLLGQLLRAYALPPGESGALRDFLQGLPAISMNRFLNLLSLLHFLLRGEELSAAEALKATQTMLAHNVAQKRSAKVWESGNSTHGTYLFEQHLLHLVSQGDELALRSFLDSVTKSQPLREGRVADDALRQAKNIFIALICMVGKVGAIRGNLDVEQAYSLIDLYTQECERCTTVREVTELQYSALMDFTRRVAELRHPEAYSNAVYEALQFIKTHTTQPLRPSDVVAAVGPSRSGLMRMFKEETGTTLGEAITQAKLQEAKQLLRYSEQSLGEISSLLYFSSQSYFQNQFKKAFGITPLQYRKRRQNV